MRILLVDKEEFNKVGGIGVFTQRLKLHLINREHEAYVVRFSNKKNNQKNTFHIPYYFANERAIFVPKEESLSLFKKYIFNIKPDIVYTAIGLSPLDIFIPTICHEFGIPAVGVWHADLNNSDSSYQLILKSLFLTYSPICKQFDLLHVFTDKLAQYYINRGINRNKILVLPNGVDTNIYKRIKQTKFKQKHAINRGILFLGRLTSDKNPKMLINSFLNLNPQDNTKLVLVGPGDLERSLREEYKDKRIIFTGLVKDEKEKVDILSSCEIFVLPSKFEGMPLALLEAMSCGLACIASDAGSNGEVLDRSGVVINHSHIKTQLPFALKLLLDYPVLTEFLAERARERMLDRYSQEVIFGNLVSNFKNVVNKFRKKNLEEKHISIDKKIINKIESLWRKTIDYVV